MVKRNNNFTTLSKNYLFAEIDRIKKEFLGKHPDVTLFNLGVGDTTLPLSPSVVQALTQSAEKLGDQKTYTGYGPGLGFSSLRSIINKKFYGEQFSIDEITISDGAKCDIARLQVLFGQKISVLVQDPSYPPYVDGSRIQGIEHIYSAPCLPENGFFFDLSKAPRTDLIYVCSPNNPTGHVATKKQLEDLVALAKKNRSIIIFDAAYSTFITDPSLPRSIYEVEGAKEVAIEVHSFSKMGGFTGVRLGWSIVPKELHFEGGEKVLDDWTRLIGTSFNGASIIAQAGGFALLESHFSEIKAMTDRYMTGTRALSKALKEMGIEVYGGENAPFIWFRLPGWKSWELFKILLEKCQVVSTPGSGFGPAGEGFVRLSGFAPPEVIAQAIEKIGSLLVSQA